MRVRIDDQPLETDNTATRQGNPFLYIIDRLLSYAYERNNEAERVRTRHLADQSSTVEKPFTLDQKN